MIYPQTILTVADNTGAKKVMCIRILGGNKKYAEIGDTIIAVVKEAIPNMPIKRNRLPRLIQKYELFHVQQRVAEIGPGFFARLGFAVGLGLGVEEGGGRGLFRVTGFAAER